MWTDELSRVLGVDHQTVKRALTKVINERGSVNLCVTRVSRINSYVYRYELTPEAVIWVKERLRVGV